MISQEETLKILLVDDDEQALSSTHRILSLNPQFDVITACDGQEALEKVRALKELDLVITDVRMPRMGGIEFLKAVKVVSQDLPVILMTAFGQVDEAVWAMKFGAVDFLMKPFKKKALLDAVQSSLTRRARPQSEWKASRGIVARSPQMTEVLKSVDQVAQTEATVLILGESGVGKERIARAIHAQSSRASRRFIGLNCAAIPENLMESELFGHERGAFSGAHQAKVGLFELAHQGTLLLDEIGDLPLSLQGKLLRVLQEKEIRRVGSASTKKVDVRVISATHQNLAQRVKEGAFREDLFYRLEVVSLEIPPLRERPEDISVLIEQLMTDLNQKHKKQVRGISEQALRCLLSYSWPGNVRELSNVIERAVIFSEGATIELDQIPSHISSQAESSPHQISIPMGTPLKEVEEIMIKKTLEATAGDKNMTAKILGVNSRTIYRKLRDPV